MNGAQALVKFLEDEGVEIIFGIPGGVVLSIYDAFYDSKIRNVLTRHEQGAAHAADGYARATGRVGVCLATSGPGATNLVTGLANAFMDSIPLVAITGQVDRRLLGRDSFQEADTTGITMPITKHNYLVKDLNRLLPTLKEAFYIASTGRPGPVLVDIPADISAGEIKYEYPEEVNLKGYKPIYVGHKKQIQHAVKAISKSEKPLLYVGGGVISSNATEELFALAEKINAPVTTTLMGKGAFPETHHLSLGMLGMHGTYYANRATAKADLIIAVGVRFDDRVTGRLDKFARNTTVIHADIDPAEIGKNVKIDIPIVGDAKNIINSFIEEVEEKKHIEWLAMIEDWKTSHPLKYNLNHGLAPQYVVDKIYEITKGNAIITTEVGQNQMWAAQYYKCTKPRTFISSGGLGTMGFGFPAAIGAQFGCPDRLVIDIAGDGSFMMNIQELTTAVCHKLPVKVAILNNKYLGMVRQWQKMFYRGRYSGSCLEGNPNFAKVAEAFGAHGFKVTSIEEVVPTIEKALTIDGPVVMDFDVVSEEKVLPMVPKGAAIDEMIEE